MRRYLIESKERKYAKWYEFLFFARKYKKCLLHTRPDSLKTASEKVVHKADEFLGNKHVDTVTKLDDDKIVKLDEDLRNVEEIIIPPEKKWWSVKHLQTSIIKMEHYKISKLLNDSVVSKFVTKKMGRSKWFIKWSIFCQQKYKV